MLRLSGDRVSYARGSVRERYVNGRSGDLPASDARGGSLRAWLSPRSGRLLIAADDRGAHYPLGIDPFIQHRKELVRMGAAPDSAGPRQGFSLALSDDRHTALIGSRGDNNTRGAGWVFVQQRAVAHPSNKFTVSHIRTFANGTIHFWVKVPGPGTIDVLETASKDNLATTRVRLQAGRGRFVFAHAHRTARDAGTLPVTVTPNRHGALLVHHHFHRVTLRLSVRYTPTAGKSRSIGFYGLHLPTGCSDLHGKGNCGARRVGSYTCTQHVTTRNFASAFSSDSGGAVLCLAPGNYGAFDGGSESSPGVVITADSGAGGTESNVVFGAVSYASSSWITLDSVTVAGVTISGAANHLTVSHAKFTDFTIISDVQNANILFDDDQFTWGATCGTTGPNALFLLDYSGAGSSGVTVQNSTFANSDCDGVHTGTALNVLNNTFYNLCDVGTNHTDNIQFQGAVGGRIAGNFIHEPLSCPTQGITSFDGGTNGVMIEDNVVDTQRPNGIEFYADVNSIIRHNTVPYRVGACAYDGNCGGIDIDCKPSEFSCSGQAGSGTQVYDNIANVSVHNGAVLARNDHNHNGPQVRYVGAPPLPPASNGYASFSDYLLAAGSAGKNAADDGTDLGITGPA